MNKDRRELLKQKVYRPLVSAFVKLLARPNVSTIDIEMYWPPDHDAIHFSVSVDKSEVDWNFTIPTKHWRLASESSDEFSDDLYPEIKHLFRAAWKEASAKAKETRAYLRLHDSTASVDLITGREIRDNARADYVEPDRKPFSRKARSTKRNRRNGELVRRGDPLSKIKKTYGVSENPVPIPFTEKSEYVWPERGVRLEIEKGKLLFIVYFDPFPDCICEIWIGAHAWEVDEILGRAKAEYYSSIDRLWQYDIDGFMSVGFDHKDRVRTIGR